jgi:8-oxo-dGTP pyrophosphatase MutT (NUDIX family)
MPGVQRGAAAIIFDNERRVLFVRWRRAPGFYGLPGGRIEPGEEPHDAVVREVREETGLAVRVRRLSGVYAFDSTDDQQLCLVMYAFLCETRSGEATLAAPAEISEVGWFDPRRLPAPLENVAPYAVADVVTGNYGTVRLGLRWHPV